PFPPPGDHRVGSRMNRHWGGVIADNPLAADEHQRIRRAQVDREVIREFLGPSLEQHHTPPDGSLDAPGSTETPTLMCVETRTMSRKAQIGARLPHTPLHDADARGQLGTSTPCARRPAPPLSRCENAPTTPSS